MSDTLALAGRLQAESDDALIRLLNRRHLAQRDLRDFFDLADALLAPESVQDALSQLSRPTLAAVASADVTRDSASPELQQAFADVLLYESGGVLRPYDCVLSALESWPTSGLPSVAELSSIAPPAATAPPTAAERNNTDERGAERSFETTVAVTELVYALKLAPARELAKGGLAVPDAKRLSIATGLPPEQMNAILRVASTARLVVRDGASWFASTTATEWMLLHLPERWAALSAAWRDSQPEQIIDVLIERADSAWGSGLSEALIWLYPAGGGRLDAQIAGLTADAELLGLEVGGRATSAAAALLADGTAGAASEIAPLMPPEVETVYLQHDLTVVAPGPLRPDLDQALRAMAQVESHSIASSFRISSGSIARALSAGYTAAGIRSFLTGISASGIPQPLDYLIGESSSRYGLLRTGALDGRVVGVTGTGSGTGSGVPDNAGSGDARSYVRSDDGELLHTIAVDQNLSSLGLVFADNTKLTSRFALETVYWMLVDARYPVIAEGAAGDPVTLTRVATAEPPAASTNRKVDELINRLRGSGVSPGGDTAEAWLVRQLDVAVKLKTPVLVTVRLPNGSEVSFPVVPTSIASGRMRGTDQKAGVERTLPLASITQVQTVTPVA